jgi:uncharacterized protein
VKCVHGSGNLDPECYHPRITTDPMKRRLHCSVLFALLTAGLARFIAAQAPAADSRPEYFQRTEVMIPMRDGIKLHTVVLSPAKASEKLPFLFYRTPYGIADLSGEKIRNGRKPLVRDGYIFVLQDIRGRYGSEGRFEMQRPPRDRSKPKAIDESTDAYDTIEWLLHHVPNHNGRAGMLGVSYAGWLTAMAMIDPHPALKAVSEQASPADMFLGDDFHHNGAFRLSYGFEYVALMETGKENYHFAFDTHDTYEWYLKLGPLSNVNTKYFHGQRPSWNDFVEHPNYDAFWQKQAMAGYLNEPRVANLNVAGWWDQEDFYGPQKIYQTLEKNDRHGWNYFVAGPWNHGGWEGGEGSNLGPVQFGRPTGCEFREEIEAPWFAWWLKDKPTPRQLSAARRLVAKPGDSAGPAPATHAGDHARGLLHDTRPMPEVETFQTGSNQWKQYDSWPPRQAQMRNLYFHDSGRLSFDAPRDLEGFDSYISDPARPVPYRKRPISPTYPGPGWPTWLTEDQRFVHLRPDVLSWQTDALAQDVVVTGDITARLFASTSGTDSDWVVKLIDVYPENYGDGEMRGYQLIIADEVMRARFRNSFERPEPVPAGKAVEYAIGLHGNDHAFLKGHRVMVQVQSTWFPLIDRNPQKFVPNIFHAVETDFQPATQRIFRSKAQASRVELPVVGP